MNHKSIFIVLSVVLTLIVSPTLLLSGQTIYAQNDNNSNKNNKIIIPRDFLQSLKKDISGHYNNSNFGIEDIIFPDGWHGLAIETGFGLLVNMHPGNESQFLSNLFNRENPVIKPAILLQALNNSAISKLNLPAFSISKYCKELAANSTSILNGKTFHVYTIECPFAKLRSSGGGADSGVNSNLGGSNNASTPSKNFNINGVGQAKVFEYKTADSTYRLMLVVSSPLLSSSASSTAKEKPDISKYIPVIDATIKTLKIK
jgi:hypothetical protein